MRTAQSVQLSIKGKRTDHADLKSPLLSYIRLNFSDKEADGAADELDQIQQIRADIVSASSATTANLAARELYSKYYRCLTAIETRFVIGKEKSQAQVNFSWYDAFRPSKRTTQPNIYFEKSAVLFNLASVVSQLGLNQDRTTPEGLTQACRFFQEAAGIFHLLGTSDALRMDSPMPQDLAPEVGASLSKLMLTQAQECIYHKAVIDKKSPGLIARLAKQVHKQYEEVAHFFHLSEMASYFDKSWAQHIDLKVAVFAAEELLQQARQFRAEDQINIEIALLKEAFARIEVCRRFAKSVDQDMIDSVVKLQETTLTQLNKAERENGTIYLLKVPTFADVPPVTAAGLLVKAVPPANLDASQEVFFTGLVPDQCAKAVSRYQAMVDEAVRRQLDRLAAATDAGRLRLRVAELPDLLEALDTKTRRSLPFGLQQELEQVEQIGGAAHLKELMKEIAETRTEVEEELAGCLKPLEEDTAADAAAREKFGDRWLVPLAATMTKPYWDRISKFRGSMAKARESDVGVERRLAASASAFQTLSVEAAAAAMPRLQAPLLITGPDDPVALVSSLRRNLEVLQSLSVERVALEDALKSDRARDDVLPKIMASSSQHYDQLFAQEIKKYDLADADVSANVTRQEELLAQVERDAATFKELFDVRGWRSSCEAAAQATKESVRQFRELLDHCGEGLRFYIGIAEVVKKTRTECEDFAFTRSVQRDELTQRLEAQEAADRKARETAERQAKDKEERHAAWLASQMTVAASIGEVGPDAPPPPHQAPHPGPPPPEQYPSLQSFSGPSSGPPPTLEQQYANPPSNEAPPPQHPQQAPPQQYQYQQQPPPYPTHQPPYGSPYPPPQYKAPSVPPPLSYHPEWPPQPAPDAAPPSAYAPPYPYGPAPPVPYNGGAPPYGQPYGGPPASYGAPPPYYHQYQQPPPWQ